MVNKNLLLKDLEWKIVGLRTLLTIGGTEFNPNSPIKKYRRCPGVRNIVKYFKKFPQCDIVFVDEYNTSKVCARCFIPFERNKHKYWERKGIRHRVCDNCVPNDTVINLPDSIISPKGQKQLQLEKAAARQHFYTNNPLWTWKQTKKFVRSYYDNMPAERKVNGFNKLLFDPFQHKQLQKQVWNRDISAARNIIIKGISLIMNVEPPVTLRRPPPRNNQHNQ